MPTREPTPDQRIVTNKRILVNLKNRKHAKLNKSVSSEDLKKENIEFDKRKSHLKFLTDITNDIIERGIYTDKRLRAAISCQVKIEIDDDIPKKFYNLNSDFCICLEFY